VTPNPRSERLLRELVPELRGPIEALLTSPDRHDDPVFARDERLGARTEEGRWWRRALGGAQIATQAVYVEGGESAARTLAFAPHSKPLDWQCDELSELVERAARELRSRFGDVDYVAVSAGGLGLPSPDDYALLCFVTEEGRWLGVDAVSVFSLGASGAAAISALCTGNPWREHLGVVGELWR
jgi:hypothetical protein